MAIRFVQAEDEQRPGRRPEWVSVGARTPNYRGRHHAPPGTEDQPPTQRVRRRDDRDPAAGWAG